MIEIPTGSILDAFQYYELRADSDENAFEK